MQELETANKSEDYKKNAEGLTIGKVPKRLTGVSSIGDPIRNQ